MQESHLSDYIYSYLINLSTLSCLIQEGNLEYKNVNEYFFHTGSSGFGISIFAFLFTFCTCLFSTSMKCNVWECQICTEKWKLLLWKLLEYSLQSMRKQSISILNQKDSFQINILIYDITPKLQNKCESIIDFSRPLFSYFHFSPFILLHFVV